MNDNKLVAYTTARAAVAASIQQDETVSVALPEDIGGVRARVAAVVEDLHSLGMEDYNEENDGSIDVWGTLNGQGWRVRTVDGFVANVEYATRSSDL